MACKTLQYSIIWICVFNNFGYVYAILGYVCAIFGYVCAIFRYVCAIFGYVCAILQYVCSIFRYVIAIFSLFVCNILVIDVQCSRYSCAINLVIYVQCYHYSCGINLRDYCTRITRLLHKNNENIAHTYRNIAHTYQILQTHNQILHTHNQILHTHIQIIEYCNVLHAIKTFYYRYHYFVICSMSDLKFMKEKSEERYLTQYMLYNKHFYSCKNKKYINISFIRIFNKICDRLKTVCWRYRCRDIGVDNPLMCYG